MAQLWTTGPAHLFVGLNVAPPAALGLAPAAGTGAFGAGARLNNNLISPRPVYVGTAETKPKIEFRKANKPVHNDIGGDIVPFDEMYTGEEAFIAFDLNRFNVPILEQLAETPVVRNNPGVDLAGDVGTLWLTEGFGITVWVWFPHSSKAAFRAGGNGTMRTGYRFPACTWAGPETQDIGMTPWKRPAIFHALRNYNVSTGAFTLYDQNLAGLPNID